MRISQATTVNIFCEASYWKCSKKNTNSHNGRGLIL